MLMYFNRPTRWTWFAAAPPTIFKEKEWIIIPVDFGIGMRPRSIQEGDYSERVSLKDVYKRQAHSRRNGDAAINFFTFDLT